MKRIVISLLAVAAAMSAAYAHQALVEVDDKVEVPALGANADTVDDWDVYLADGTEIGEVDDVVGTDRTTPTALVVDFDNRSGYPGRDIVVPLEHFARTNDRLILNADAAAVGSMQGWND